MKRFILSITIASVFAACGQKRAEEIKVAQSAITDTTGSAAFEQWKEGQATVDMNGVQEPVQPIEEPVVEKPVKQKPVQVVYREAPVRQQPQPRVVRSSTPVREKVERPVVTAPVDNSETGSGSSSGSTGNAGTGVGAGTETGTGTGQAETPAAKKEGWSKAAKGTAIGGASGAVLGAIISKDKGKGAVIGGIVGAAGGYIFGRAKDKKDGRY